jgi:hypothetical protein
MIALSDTQLTAVMTAAGKLPAEKRGVFLERVVARLGLLPRFTDVRSTLEPLAADKKLAFKGLVRRWQLRWPPLSSG